MNGEKQELKLLENVVTELQHIKDKLTNSNTKLDTLITGQKATNDKLDQIIKNTTPTASDDIVSLGGSISPPVKKNP